MPSLGHFSSLIISECGFEKETKTCFELNFLDFIAFIFWFEFIFYHITKKKEYFVSFFFNKYNQIFPDNSDLMKKFFYIN